MEQDCVCEPDRAHHHRPHQKGHQAPPHRRAHRKGIPPVKIALAVVALLLAPAIADAACRCSTTKSLTGTARTVCKCERAQTTVCTATKSLTGRLHTLCR